MKPSKNTLIAVLVFAVAALGAFSWHQYRELIDLRAQVADGDLAMLKKQLADSRKAIKSLEDRIAALRGRRGGSANVAADGTEGEGPDANGGRGRPGGRFGAFEQLNSNPEFQKLLALQMRARVSQTFGPLFKSLNLTPDQLAQFQSLLADKTQAVMDTMQAAREQGINPRTDPDGFKTLVNQAVSQVDATIQQTIGDAGYQQYQQYQQTIPERNTVNSLQQQLSYTQTPLTDDEANQMVSLLAQNQPQRAGSGTAGTSGNDTGTNLMEILNGGGTAKITNDAVTAATGVLSQPQVAVLQQVQTQQQAQQQMQQLMRSAAQGGPPSSGTAPATGAGGSKG